MWFPDPTRHPTDHTDITLYQCSQSSRCEQCDCRRRHDCGSEPSQNIGGETVCVFAHEAFTARYSHNDEEEWCCGHTIDHCDKDEQFDWIDVQETERGAANCS